MQCRNFNKRTVTWGWPSTAKTFCILILFLNLRVLYNIFIEFGVPMKLVRLIKMCLNKTCSNVCIDKHLGSWDTVVGIVTGYGLGNWGVGVRVPVGSRIFSSLRCPERLWGPPNLLSNEYRGFFPLGGKAAGAWSWPLTFNQCRGQDNVDLYIHSHHTPSWCSVSLVTHRVSFTLDKHLCDKFPIQNGLKWDALLPLLCNFALEYALGRSKKIGLDWN
jgi:hypothetical protein